MENVYLADVTAEISGAVRNRTLRRVWQSGNDLFFDVGLSRTFRDVVVASLDPASPLLFLYRPQAKKDANSLPGRGKDETISPFSLLLKSRTTGARLAAIKKQIHDRVLTLEFVDGPEIAHSEFTVRLSFTGRSSNASLIADDGSYESSLRKAGRPEEGGQNRLEGAEEFDLESALNISPESTIDSIEAKWFGKASPLGPLMKTEFLARAESLPPAMAFKTLVEDVFKKPHRPLLYSRLPLEQAGERQVKPGTDLVLAPFNLVSASGMPVTEFSSFSAAATEYWLTIERSRDFQKRYRSALSQLGARLKGLRSTLQKIESDLARFQDPDKFRRFGDLILANLGSSRIVNGKVRLKDYFDQGESEIEIEAGDARTLQEAAAHYYGLYRKGRRTRELLAPRSKRLKLEIKEVETWLENLEGNPSAGAVSENLAKLGGSRDSRRPGSRAAAGRSGKTRRVLGKRFRSSDGYEIVVGRNDSENDEITFRVAGSQDVWLHAADYPGSHVVVKNPTRKPIAPRTIVEAAELAAFHSQAKRDSKVAVHHTLKKFVTKPPRAKPGLVRLSSFKTLLVEPRCELERVFD